MNRAATSAARAAAALFALSGAAGCADGLSPLASGMTWRQFVAADDLRRFCEEGAPDRYRIVVHLRPRSGAAAQVRLIEIEENREQGGAQARGRTLTPADMAQTGVDDGYSDWRGAFASYSLTPLQFAALAHRLEKAGAFETPEFGVRAPRAPGLLIGGCRAGTGFFNAFEDPALAGELI